MFPNDSSTRTYSTNSYFYNAEDDRYNNPDNYFNRELSWLDFNLRCIDQAYDDENPLLEQLNFIAIGSSNLDEFYMVRVAGVYDQYLADVYVAENKTFMRPVDLLQAISDKNHRNVVRQYDRYRQLMPQLAPLGFHLKEMTDLSNDETKQAKQIFTDLIEPTLSPLGLDPYHPFPQLRNKGLNILVGLSQDDQNLTATIPIPNLLDRYFLINDGDQQTIILIEDLIISQLDQLFKGYKIEYAFPFRITRNADLDIIEEGAADLLLIIENYVKNRKKGMAVRLEIDARYLNSQNQKPTKELQHRLGLHNRDIYLLDGPLDLTYLFSLIDDIGSHHPEHLYKAFHPYLNPNHLGESLFDSIEKGDIFLNHPYDSFDPVVSFIETAAEDPNTIAIKQTLYRVSKNSPIIAALKQAAENGKEVTVLVELKARFDEENNVHWARELEEAGCHVLYGVSELKTHSKITLIVKRKGNKVKRYTHLATGNYNDKTAKTYTDMGIFTANEEIGQDASHFFNYLSGYTERPDYIHLHVSPFAIRDSLIDYIDDEINYQQQYGNGHIIAKMNSLTDKPLINKLYDASQAGVKIDLIVRGICCLRPGIPGLSDNIQVRSIVGRFLEHSRIYYFNHNGNNHLFLSSADMMTRNMTKRVEIEFPILDSSIKDQIYAILKLQLADNAKARQLQTDGNYTYPSKEEPLINAQESQINQATEKQAISNVRQSNKKLSNHWLGKLFPFIHK